MRLDLFVKNNLLLLLKNCPSFSSLEKKELLILPRAFWQKEIILGNIKIQNKLVKPSFNIDIKNISSINIAWRNIKFDWNIIFREHYLGYPAPLKILLDKPNFSVVSKPVGLSVHPTFPLNQRLPRKTTLIEVLIAYFPEATLVHRLDKETSGVLLVAKNNKTKIYLKKQFKNHEIKKVYYALVEGDFPYKKFKISSLIGKKINNPIKRGVKNIVVQTFVIPRLDRGIQKIPSQKNLDFRLRGNDTIVYSTDKYANIINPKESSTFGEKIATGTLDNLVILKMPTGEIVGYWKKYLKPSKKKYSVLKLTPKTGRTHQLRTHLDAIGFPIVGDKLYGKSRNNSIPFHCLHAYSLQWTDTNSKKYLVNTGEIILF